MLQRNSQNAITTIQNANVKYGGGSARFQTGDSYVSYGQQEHLDFSGTWTVDMWVNFDALPANGNRMDPVVIITSNY